MGEISPGVSLNAIGWEHQAYLLSFCHASNLSEDFMQSQRPQPNENAIQGNSLPF
jgi:hypothetical protein